MSRKRFECPRCGRRFRSRRARGVHLGWTSRRKRGLCAPEPKAVHFWPRGGVSVACGLDTLHSGLEATAFVDDVTCARCRRTRAFRARSITEGSGGGSALTRPART